LGRGALDPGQGLDVGAFEPLPGDREVLDGALCLRPPLRPGGDAYLAHGIVLDAEVVAHTPYSARRDALVPGRGSIAPFDPCGVRRGAGPGRRPARTATPLPAGYASPGPRTGIVANVGAGAGPRQKPMPLAPA